MASVDESKSSPLDSLSSQRQLSSIEQRRRGSVMLPNKEMTFRRSSLPSRRQQCGVPVLLIAEEQFSATGNFESDLNEMCQRTSLPLIPVAPRPTRSSPLTVAPTPEVTHTKPGKEDKSSRQVAAAEVPKPCSSHDLQETQMTTFATKDKEAYFKPRIEVKCEAEGPSNITEMYIRGWQVDMKMMVIFTAILPMQENLETIDLWNAGLNDDTLDAVVAMVKKLPDLRNLHLDGSTTIVHHRYDQLLEEPTTIQHLSLRHSYVNDVGACLFGNALSSNKTLLSLNLAFNKITCEGAKAIAKGLRMNRSLLTLNLSNNRIADKGANHMAEVLRKYALTHEEIVQRRKLISRRNGNESVSPTRSLLGQSTSKESTRPQSVRSSSHLGKDEKKGREKATGKKKDGATGGNKKDERGKKGSLNADSPSRAKQAKKSTAPKQEKGKQALAENESEEADVPCPLLDVVEEQERPGEIWVSGNQSLLSLSLARNSIGESGLVSLFATIDYQRNTCPPSDTGRATPFGLMKLNLQNNAFPRDHPVYVDLQQIMRTRDPLYKEAPAAAHTLDP